MTKLMRWIYRDMIEDYYDREGPLSASLVDLCECLGLFEPEEVKAAERVLKLKFELREDGYHHHVCDKAIEKYKSAAEDDLERQKNEAERQRRHRDRRKAIFKQLRDEFDIVPDFDTSMSDLSNTLSTCIERLENTRRTEDKQVSNVDVTRDIQVHTSDATAITKNQEPRTNNHKPRTKKNKSNPSAPSADAPPEKAEPGTGKVWAAYARAYWRKYQVEPVRNAKVNGMLSQLVKRLGVEEAPHVAEFYLTHNNRYYVEKMHDVAPLLADCEKIRTEWATATQMTQAKARQADSTATNHDSFAPLIAAAKEREERERNNYANK